MKPTVPPELTADQWRRVGAVLDRLSDTDFELHPESVDEACRREGVPRDLVEPFLAAERRADRWSERLDPTVLHEALRAHGRGGSTAAPPLDETLVAVGKELSRRRLRLAGEHLKKPAKT